VLRVEVLPLLLLFVDSSAFVEEAADTSDLAGEAGKLHTECSLLLNAAVV
jgi:hypothetical protein